MPTATITIMGNLCGDPELRYTPSGVPVASMSVAVNERYRDQAGEWKDGATSFFKIHVWRDQAEHVAESLSKGDRVIVHGPMRQRQYEAKDGTKRDSWEIQADEIAASLRYATVKITKTRRDNVPVPDDTWSYTDAPVAPAPQQEEPPF